MGAKEPDPFLSPVTLSHQDATPPTTPTFAPSWLMCCNDYMKGPHLEYSGVAGQRGIVGGELEKGEQDEGGVMMLQQRW